MSRQDSAPFVSSISHSTSDPFRLLVESVLDYAIFMLDPAGRVASWNPGAERIYGYKTDEIVGRHLVDFYPPVDGAEAEAEDELRIVRELGSYENECIRVRKDGSQFWAITTVSSLKDHFGHHIGYAKVTRDISERRNSVEALRQERDLSTSILQSLPGVYYAYDESGRFLR